MKILASLLISLIAILAITTFFLGGYRSAFEADQQCHYEKWNNYGEDISFGCDHDLETQQWILFEAGENHQPATVIKRFSYRRLL